MGQSAVIVNLKGGTAMGMTKAEVREAFAEHGDVIFAHGDDLPATVEKTFSDTAHERVIVAGGDGTASLAAKWSIGTGKPFGIIPLGTMNLFARTIGMPLDTQEAIASLIGPEVRRVDCAEVNGTAFINHLSLGFHPQLVRMRDSIPRGSRLVRMWNGMRVYLRLMRHHQRLRLKIEGDFDPLGVEAGLLVVSVNPIQEGTAQIPHSEGQADGELGLYISTHKSAWDLNKVVWRLLNGTLRESEHVAFRRTREVKISAPSAMHMSMDGEVSVNRSPLTCRMVPGGLKVLMPKGSTEAD